MISNVKEFEIERPGDLVMERRSLSGKKQINSLKMLSAMDHNGRCIFVRVKHWEN